MPGARSIVKPAPASDFSASDEASQLEHHLQQQLEEDVARIFDESIYSDLEVVCGKLKILTHSCILKARTNNFYHKLETILHTNFGQKTFDEIYSFISDAYTECNIKHQEKEIITYLDDNLNVVKTVLNKTLKPKENIDEQEVFLTPKCATPYVENKFEKTIITSPSTDLTKEYYALVPIEGNLLEKELIEQDALSTAFHSLVKSQGEESINDKTTLSQRNKPTSLLISSSHSLKTVKHSSSCDILINHTKDNSNTSTKSIVPVNKQINEHFETNHTIPAGHTGDVNDLQNELNSNKVFDSVYSPDSLITDEPSSSSDYLSAAYTCSPGVSSAAYIPQLNVGKNIFKMENVFTSSDSGLENTGLLESLGSHKDVTLTDVSLTESTLHDLTTDDTNDSVSSSLADRNQLQKIKHGTWSSISGTSSDKDVNGTINQSSKPKDTPCKSSKEEKQRQNEEIVILESSSLSSETGSWESVFPPKIAEREICEKFICNERQYSNDSDTKYKVGANFREDLNHSLVQKSPFKSTSCFIDAASLADEEDDTIQVQTDTNELLENVRSDTLPAPSQPVPCSTARSDISPNDWSENNENEDSLEQADKDPDSIQKDLSPTIFEMTPITEDSLCGNTFENAAITELKKSEDDSNQVNAKPFYSQCSNTVFVSNTPHNSIMSLKAANLKQYESEESESDTTFVGREGQANIKFTKFNECSPIVSGGASIEDHLPLMASQTASPLSRRKIENIPIVSGAYIPPDEDSRKSPKLSSASAWVVDMSTNIKSEVERNNSSINNPGVKKPGDRTCESLRNGSKSSLESCHTENVTKSRNSIDSDSSEKSSHKFYIDLSNLPAPETSDKPKDSGSNREKKNIFSMYIDLGEKPTVKEMPARLSSSLNARKSAVETKSMSKSYKSNKTPSDVSSACSRSDDSLPCASTVQLKCIDNTVTTTIESSETIKSPNLTNVKNDSSVIIKDRPVPAETMTHDKKARNLDADRSHQRFVTVPIQKEPTKDTVSDLFVKLSDLDKPLQKLETMTISEGKVLDVRMTRSIPENNWGNQSNTVASKSIEVINSFHSENALSLNRLFPHLQNEFSRSMPGSLSGQTRSPLRIGTTSGDFEEQASDMSEISSAQSSMCRSVIENSTTEETSQMSSLIGNCQSRLGQDLLRMFLEEIAPDVIVEVSGRRIKAHKCILSSRCQYFAGILSGGWVESAGNVIVLPPFSFNVVHFALCHIYSGLSTIPDTISIVELATIADMLGLEGLKEAIMFTLKAKYCHHFHRPCQVCTAGVLECFPLSAVYGLDDLYRKCLRWITKYFPKVWPTKAFATLPKELLDKCYQQHMINLTTENLVDTVYGCGITVASLQNSRWSESVSRMCRRLVNAVAHFAAPRLVRVLDACARLPPDAPDPAKQALDDCLAAAIEWAPPDEACHAYAFLCALIKEMRNNQFAKPDLIANGNQNKTRPKDNLLTTHAYSWRMQCEGALVRSAPRVVGSQAFKDLPLDLRKRLRELGCIMFGTQALPVTASPQQERKTRSTYQSPRYKTPTASNRSLDIDQVRASFVPYVPKPAAPVGSIDILRSNNDLRDKKIKSLNPPKIRTTKAQEERAKFNLLKNNQSQDRLSSKTTNSIRMSFENTKPRYLEPKVVKDGERKMTIANNKLVPKMVSSSESSRNSSPVQTRSSRMRPPAAAMSRDSLVASSRPRTAEPSTDSLSESQNSNKYATYTKAKHTTKGSIESINFSRYQNGQTTNNKLKTKIPVYQATKTNSKNCQEKRSSLAKKPVNTNNTITISSPSTAKKMSGSLMNATKSSSAKMVPKILKEQQTNKCTPKQVRKGASSVNKDPPQEKTPDIPVMERSGTFLKDEPTFGDKTTNIDIDQ